MFDSDYIEKIKNFVESTDWAKLYTDDDYKLLKQEDFKKIFTSEISFDEKNINQTVNAYGHYNTFDRVHQIVMMLLGLAYSKGTNNSIQISDESAGIFGWMKEAAEQLLNSGGQRPNGSKYTQDQLINVGGQAMWTLTAIQSAVSNIMNMNTNDDASVMSAARGIANSVLEASALGKNLWRDIGQADIPAGDPSRAGPRNLSIGLLGLFAASGAVELTRQAIIESNGENIAEHLSAGFGIAGAALGSVGGNVAKAYSQYCDASLAAMGTNADEVLAANLRGVKTVSNNLGTILNFAGAVSGIISTAVLLGDPTLSDAQKTAIKEELGIQASSAVAALVLEGAMVAGLVAGPAGLALSGLVAMVASLSPTTWAAVDAAQEATNFYASQVKDETGTLYRGNIAMENAYKLQHLADIFKSVPIPFLNVIMGAVQDAETNADRWDNYSNVTSSASGISGGVQSIFNQYYLNALNNDDTDLQPLKQQIYNVTSNNLVKNAQILETMWAPSTSQDYAAYSHVGYYMPTSAIESLYSLTYARDYPPTTPSVIGNLGTPDNIVLRGHDWKTGGDVVGQDYTNSGVQQALRLATSDGTTVFISKGNPELTSHDIDPPNAHTWNVYKYGSNHTSWNLNGIQYIMVDDMVKVDFGSNPTMNLSSGLSKSDSQYIAIGSPLSSPTNQLRYNHAHSDTDIKGPDGTLREWDTDDSSWIYRDKAWYRAWNFKTGDAATTFDMGIEVTPTAYERSNVQMGLSNDVLILGNRPVDADLGAGYNTADYSKVGLGASSVGIVVTANDGQVSVTRTIKSGPIWVEGEHYSHFSWSNNESAWMPYLKPDNIGANSTFILNDNILNVQAIKGSTGDDSINTAGTNIKSILGSAGNDFITSSWESGDPSISLDYSGIDGGIVANFSDSPFGAETGYVQKNYKSFNYDADGNPILNYDSSISYKESTGYDQFVGLLSSIVGTSQADSITVGDKSTIIIGGGGDDAVKAGAGDNVAILSGGSFAVSMGNGNNMIVLDGPTFSGHIDCGSGSNTLAFSGSKLNSFSNAGIYANLNENIATYGESRISFSNISTLIGTDGNDILVGKSSGSTLIGNGGSDYLQAQGGDSVLVANTSSSGGNAPSGSTTVYGNSTGRNLMISMSGTQNVSNAISNGIFAGTARGTYMNDFYYGEGSNNTIDYSNHFSDVPSWHYGMTIDLSGMYVTNYSNGNSPAANYGRGLAGVRCADASVTTADTLVGIQNAVATNGADLIYCGDNDSTINALNGDDQIFCGAGKDTLILGAGSKNIVGGTGSASVIYNLDLNESQGSAQLGIWGDLYSGKVYKGVDGLGNSTLGTDNLTGVETISAAGVNSKCVLWGDDNDNVLIGGMKDNELYARGGNDVLVGGGGCNSFHVGSGNAQLFGGNGNNDFIISAEKGDMAYLEATDIIDQNGFEGPEVVTAVGALLNGVKLERREIDIIDTTQSLRPGTTDTLEMNSNLNDLWFSRSENNLLIQANATNTEINVKDWYSSYGSGLQKLKLDGGVGNESSSILFSQLDSFLSGLASSSGWKKIDAAQIGNLFSPSSGLPAYQS